MSEWCDKISQISVYNKRPQDCTFLDGYIWWIEGKYNGSLHKSNPDTGAIIATYNPPGSYPRGIANDGEYLWFSDNLNKRVYKIDPSDGSEILNKYHGLGAQVGGLTYLNGYLYLVRRSDEKCYKINPANGNVISNFDMTSCGGNMWGLGNDGENLWNTINDGAEHGREIEKLSPSGEVLLTCTPSNIIWSALVGCCYDGSNLRVCDDGWVIYKLGEAPSEEVVRKKWALHRVGIRFVRL